MPRHSFCLTLFVGTMGVSGSRPKESSPLFSALEAEALKLESQSSVPHAVEPSSMSRAEQQRLFLQSPLIVAARSTLQRPQKRSQSGAPPNVTLMGSETNVVVVAGSGLAIGRCTYVQELHVTVPASASSGSCRGPR